MDNIDNVILGINLKKARVKANLSQSALARQSRVNRVNIVRMEVGSYSPQFFELLRIAEILKIPLQQFLTGRNRPSLGLKGIAFELYNLGIRDVVVDDARVPGAFRRYEQVVVLALMGDRPETRLVDAMPLVLAKNKLNVQLTLAYANRHDRRVRARIAWLSEVTLSLGRLSTFPMPVRTQEELERFTRSVKKPDEQDSLGYPGATRSLPIWRRWNITYGGTMDDFLKRAISLSKSNSSDDNE